MKYVILFFLKYHTSPFGPPVYSMSPRVALIMSEKSLKPIYFIAAYVSSIFLYLFKAYCKQLLIFLEVSKGAEIGVIL